MRCDDDLKPPRITISLDFLSESQDIRIKESVLHEVGHLHHSPTLSRKEGEYQAGAWALAKARELNDPSLEKEVVRVLQSWNDPSLPEYYYAYEKAVANGIIKPPRYVLCRSGKS
jgi:hypothetical protein